MPELGDLMVSTGRGPIALLTKTRGRRVVGVVVRAAMRTYGSRSFSRGFVTVIMHTDTGMQRVICLYDTAASKTEIEFV